MNDQRGEFLYIKVRRHLLQLIKKNYRVPEYRLPSENELVEQLGVSRITAKRALNSLAERGLVYRKKGKGSFPVPSAAEHYDFPGSGRGSVHFIIPNFYSEFIRKILEGAAGVLENHGYFLNICSSYDSKKREADIIRQCLDHETKGLLVFPVNDENCGQELLRLALDDFPLIILDKPLRGLDISIVSSNHYKDGYDVTEDLIEKGYKKIAFISYAHSQTSSASERIQGFKNARHDNLHSPDSNPVLILEYGGDWMTALREFLKNCHPDALISYSGIIGVQLLQVLKDENINPELTFFDEEYQELFEYYPGKVNFLEQNALEIGARASALLVRQLEDGHETGHEKIFIPSHLRQGESRGSHT